MDYPDSFTVTAQSQAPHSLRGSLPSEGGCGHHLKLILLRAQTGMICEALMRSSW